MIPLTPDFLLEIALIEASRAQREALRNAIWRPKK